MRSAAMTAAVLATVIGMGSAQAIPLAVVTSVSTYQIEAQGFAGRMRFPTPASVGGITPLSTSFGGVSSDGQYAYFCNSQNSFSSQLRKVNLITNEQITTQFLGRGLSDISSTNGQLYGIVSNTGTGNLEIVRIGANGVLTTVISQTNVAPTTGTWRLSGSPSGDLLIAYKGRSAFDAPSAGTRNVLGFTASTGASAFSFAPSSTPALASGQIADLVVESGDAGVTFVPGITSGDLLQPRAALPGGTSLGTRSTTDRIGASLSFPTTTLSSDEFNLAYPASSPAQAITTLSGGSEFNHLYRNPILWSASVTASLANGVSPDSVTMSVVGSASPVIQSEGGSPITITNTPAAPGSFSARSIGTATAQINLATAQPGVYTLATGALTGTYNSEVGRSITTVQQAIRSFAYEPVSSNVVGNGGFEYSGFGWETISSASSLPASDSGDRSIWLTPSSGSPSVIRQLMELPMSSSAMQFDFDYRVDSFPTLTAPMTFTATLGGTTIANFTVASAMTDYGHFSTIVDIPALYSLSNVELKFTVAGAAWTYLDNVSLVAVPEPASLSVLALAGLMLQRRRCVR